MSKQHTFFIDIDGTLLCRGKKDISDTVRNAILRVRSEGSKVFINTARPRAFIPSFLLDGTADGICCGGGTYIEYGGKCIYSNYIAEDVLCSVVENLVSSNDETVMCFEGAEKMYYYGEKQPWFNDTFLPVSSPDDFKTLYKGAKIQKFCTPSGHVPSEKLINALAERFKVYLYPHYAEWMAHGYNKGQAIKITEDVLGIDHGTTVAIGDSLNDAEMFEYAALSVAMGNSPDEIKAMCDMVTDTAQNDGVAKAILEICGIN